MDRRLQPGRQARGDAGAGEAWLDRVVGWDEVDALCANAFQADDFLAAWPLWSAWLTRLAADANTHKRRASLVLLTGPVRRSDDARLAELAFANIAVLQSERPILITKAVSWLLRSLVARHRGAVIGYLEAHRHRPAGHRRPRAAPNKLPDRQEDAPAAVTTHSSSPSSWGRWPEGPEGDT